MTSLFNTEARQRQRLVDLQQQRDQLLRDRDEVVLAGDDAALEKLAAKLLANQLAMKSAEDAIVAARRLADEQRREEEAEKRRAKVHEYDTALSALESAYIEFEAAVIGLVDKWRKVLKAFEVARLAARAAKLDTLESQGLAPGRVWPRVWGRFLRLVQTPGSSPWLMPSAPASANVESVAELLARRHESQPVRVATAARQLLRGDSK